MKIGPLTKWLKPHQGNPKGMKPCEDSGAMPSTLQLDDVNQTKIPIQCQQAQRCQGILPMESYINYSRDQMGLHNQVY